MKKLLLHTCCGPCFLGSYEGLKDQGFEITNYYYNPNIQPGEEWEKRLATLQKAAKGKSDGVIVAEYDPQEHANAILGKETDFPVRCLDCYRLRLEKTAIFAKENSFDLFSTTLLVSPYQQHDAIRRIGKEISEKYQIPFFYKDLREHYREGQDLAREKELYRQKYCGCLYSKDHK